MSEENTKAIDLSGDGGVLKEIYQEGTGEVPPAGDEIRGRRRVVAVDTLVAMEDGVSDVHGAALQLTTRARCWTAPSSTARATATRSSRCSAPRNPLVLLLLGELTVVMWLEQFVLGKGNVIKAWDLAFATMKVGEVRLS